MDKGVVRDGCSFLFTLSFIMKFVIWRVYVIKIVTFVWKINIGMEKKNYFSEAALKEVPTKKLSLKIRDGSITTNKLADEAITTNKIADKAVTAGKLADGIYDDMATVLEGHYLPLTGGRLNDGATIQIIEKESPYGTVNLSSTSIQFNTNGGQDFSILYPKGIFLGYIGYDDYHRLLQINKDGICYQIDKGGHGTDWQDKIRINEDGVAVHDGTITAEKEGFYTSISSDRIQMSDTNEESLFTNAATITKEKINLISGMTGANSYETSVTPSGISVSQTSKGGSTSETLIDSSSIASGSFIKTDGAPYEILMADGSVKNVTTLVGQGKTYSIHDVYNTSAKYTYGLVEIGHDAPGNFHKSIELNGGTGNIVAGGFIKEGTSDNDVLMGDGSIKSLDEIVAKVIEQIPVMQKEDIDAATPIE